MASGQGRWDLGTLPTNQGGSLLPLPLAAQRGTRQLRRPDLSSTWFG